MQGNNNFVNLCKACIILKENQDSLTGRETKLSSPSPKNGSFLVKEEGQRSDPEFSSGQTERFATETEGAEFDPTTVKLERAQGECLGIRSR